MSNKLGKKKKEKKPLLVQIIYLGLFLILLTPFIVNNKFYFPFVAPKSLFFMGLTEIVFFLWLFLIWQNPQYRPKITSLLLVLILFIIVMSLSSIWGANFSHSFWSKFERMTGLLMWFHLFLFFLVLSSIFNSIIDWEKFFIFSILISSLISIIALLELAKVEGFIISPRQGASLGNTSFLGSYLLFNIFFGLWLIFQKRDWLWKTFFLTIIIASFLAIFRSQAQAAFLSILGGGGLLFLLWLSFKTKFKKLGKILLVSSSILVLFSLILVFLPGNFIYNYLEKFIKPRYINWEIAWQGFLQRPLLGWGLENYPLFFPKLFNPCFFVSECGKEIWFDRTHNIIFDTLFSLGILGFLSYLGIFIVFFYILIKKYFKEQLINFWTFSIFSVIPVAYFIQNLTVFDMVSSLVMFFSVLAFVSFLAGLKEEKIPEIAPFDDSKLSQQGPAAALPPAPPPAPTPPPAPAPGRGKKKLWLPIFILLTFLFTFSYFIVKPSKSNILMIESLNPQLSSTERINIYQKVLQTSPLSKYQIREYFSQRSENTIRTILPQFFSETNEKRKEEIRKEVEKELDFVINELEKTQREMPLDYRSVIQLANLYNLYSSIKPEKTLLAEKYGEKAIFLSPQNQSGYWLLAQSKVYQKKFKEALELAEKAIKLEPRHFLSHFIAIQITKHLNDPQKTEELIQKALKINPEWEKELRKIYEQ